ncbi:uncharacterized protein (DUF1800 family) [Deinococcus metalli]|uniref:Uncharacterized protein (DUF1800 family) n=1 Tax=Deinococcus metalli TaxID=1141878 RepID=A0A7W8KHV2_9DEIO|nr:DUF1800 domain-containing protein [Deinococcus metalli]MBB5378377.1 uncharacterized protein (DUF1800 family) [Deinococcus metalli]GHF59352.1 hypothetical protein GCM10017781_39540 [Deinococcus metalli]
MTLTPHTRPLSAEDAAHFLRRTAFGGTDSQIRALTGRAAADATREALAFTAALAPANPFDPATGATTGAMLQLTRARWLYELVYGPHPLREKLVLTWSNHFVIGTDKVRNHPALAGYLATLRQHAATPDFTRLALAVAQTPAMLRYLDNDQNKKGKPNENFSRELLELFTVGLGPYSEADVREGARALSGWTFTGGRGNKNFLEPQAFVFNARQHDTGQKTYLGQRGNLSPEDVVRAAATHPQTALSVSRKLHRAFMADTPDERAVQGSAETWRRTNGNVGAVLTELLSSAEFYASRARIVRSPVEYVVGALRTMGQPALEPKAVLNLMQTAGRMGQVLLQPDTVKGWDGGREWINDSALLLRLQAAAALTLGQSAPTLDRAPSDLALFGSERSAAAAALTSLNARQRTYLALVSPEFQLA